MSDADLMTPEEMLKAIETKLGGAGFSIAHQDAPDTRWSILCTEPLPSEKTTRVAYADGADEIFFEAGFIMLPEQEALFIDLTEDERETLRRALVDVVGARGVDCEVGRLTDGIVFRSTMATDEFTGDSFFKQLGHFRLTWDLGVSTINSHITRRESLRTEFESVVAGMGWNCNQEERPDCRWALVCETPEGNKAVVSYVDERDVVMHRVGLMLSDAQWAQWAQMERSAQDGLSAEIASAFKAENWDLRDRVNEPIATEFERPADGYAPETLTRVLREMLAMVDSVRDLIRRTLPPAAPTLSSSSNKDEERRVKTYSEQEVYFAGNRERSLAKYKRIHEQYVATYNAVLTRSGGKTRRDAVALILLLRAAVYTNTAHDTALFGHVEEAHILLRSPVELALLSILVLNSDEAWQLWEECHNLRVQNTRRDGKVDIPKFRDKKFDVNRIVKTCGDALKSDPLFVELKRARGEFSTYWSHENLYNIVSRVDASDGVESLYIGQDADSENDRMEKVLSTTIHLMGRIQELSQRIPPEDL